MTITHQTVVDSQGKPAAALIPWSEFLLIQEILESGEVTAEEAAALREAETDRRSGNRGAFTDLASLKAELALCQNCHASGSVVSDRNKVFF